MLGASRLCAEGLAVAADEVGGVDLGALAHEAAATSVEGLVAAGGKGKSEKNGIMSNIRWQCV